MVHNQDTKESALVKYTLRLNPKAFNPITRKIIPERLWEVEQCATRDSDKVIWHCADIRVDGTPIRQMFSLPAAGIAPWEHICFGICVRGYDDVIELKTGPHDASGN
jgi:hypothetical protein